MLNVKNLIKEIHTLDKNEKQNILNILLHNTTNEDYTKNLNGYFFNLLNVDLDTLENIDKTLKVIKESRLKLLQNSKDDNIASKNLDNIKSETLSKFLELKECELQKYNICDDDEIIEIYNENIIKEEKNKIEIKIPEKRYKKTSNIYIIKQLAKSRQNKNVKYTNTRNCYEMDEVDDNVEEDDNINEIITNIEGENNTFDEEDLDIITENDLYDIENEEEEEYNITIQENLEEETIDDFEIEKYKSVLNENGYKFKTGYKLIKEDYI